MISLFRSSVKSILPLLLLVLSSLPASADRFQYGDLWFETTSENTCEVTYLRPSLGENYAFTEISIPELAVYNGQFYTVTTIGNSAFCHCSSLTSIAIPSSVTTIGYSAFSGCSSLTSIVIPSSVTTIGADAFYECSSLTSITIPSSVTTIGDYAFSGCSSLTSIVIPSSVTTIGNSAFSGCSSLTSIDVDASNTAYVSIDGVLFNKDFTTIVAYPAIKAGISYTIPNSVTTIGEGVFYGCLSLTSIVIPSSVTTIGGSAFSDCRRLTSIDIPSSVTTIGKYAFFGCSSLTSIAIPSSVTMIGDGSFGGCWSLTSITIPSSVSTIGDVAFYYCKSLTDIYNYAPVPQATGYEVFDGVPSSVTLHVVKGYKDVYEAAEVWNRFNIVDDLEVISFTFEQEEYHCAVGESFTPSVVGIDANLLEWTSSDSSILYIDPVYHLCLGRKEGVAYITATQKDHPENSATVRVIVGDSSTAIGSVTTDAPATSIYTLDGRRADHTAKGIGIVRTADGKTRKVIR